MFPSDLLERKYDEEGKPFKRKHVMELLDYCLRTYFTFNGQIYEQIQGTPMGSPISGYLAEAVMQELEARVFQSYKPKFWMRYVNDTFVILHRDAKDNFKRQLNSVFPQIQFTMEEEKDGVLPFLDVQTGRVRPLTMTAWNVRSPLYNPESQRVQWWTALVTQELAPYKVDIAALSTTLSSEQGQLEAVGAEYAFFWSGHPKAVCTQGDAVLRRRSTRGVAAAAGAADENASVENRWNHQRDTD
nr:unnamed protein product [Spirometra erinaceieuropaei]